MKAATSIARHFRGWKMRKVCARQLSATSFSQWATRSWLVRLHDWQKTKAAKLIQRYQRGFSARLKSKKVKAAVLNISATYRCHRLYCRHQRLRAAATVLVSSAWMWRHTRDAKIRRTAATRLAAAWRAYCVRVNFDHLRSKIGKIKRWWRGRKQEQIASEFVAEIMNTRRSIESVKQYISAIQIARWIKSKKKKNERWRRFKHGVVRLQARWRGHLARNEAMMRRCVDGIKVSSFPAQLAALCPGKIYFLRNGKQRSDQRLVASRPFRTKERRVFKICWLLRFKVVPTEFRYIISHKVSFLQAIFRYKKWKKSVLRIQSLFRGHVVRKYRRRRNAQALVLHAFWRGHLTRRWFQKANRAAVKLHALARGFVAKRKWNRDYKKVVKDSAERVCVCGTILFKDSAFCRNCGKEWGVEEQVQSDCAQCGNVFIDPTAVFCRKCGCARRGRPSDHSQPSSPRGIPPNGW
jgi:hypothetical protein